ncbi:MAG TPA: dTMP kinase, partial [Leptospiraceae bacterium]|nr:dTMP kinase [Leptospiraceae bacterium]
MKPFFIVIEGIDGSGKSTLSKSLFSELSRNMECCLFSEPTQFETGLKIRKHLKGEISLSKADLISEFLEDRKLSIERNIQPSLSQGKNVILDRYFYSMAAYQSDSSTSAS